MGSREWRMSKEDLKRVAVGAGVAAAGAFLAYLSEWAAGVDWGDWSPIVTAGFAIAANFVRKFATDTR